MNTLKTRGPGLHKPLEDFSCDMCGGRVRQLRKRDASRLRLTTLDEGAPLVKGFECARCEVILYEDELTFGRFVPPQLRSLPTMELASASSRDRSPLPTRAIDTGRRELLARA